ncbi:MAG: molybdenum cofactor biosynthesis protein MoaE [Granulosicoccus sp.]|nr:molybdenum cofactor biosynthesis protein MoaE [Granulosicoccus sp.]
MAIHLHPVPFDPAVELARFEASLPRGSVGATASFVGTMRNHNEGDAVAAMTLEHYPGMTEKQLEAIIQEAREQWDIIDALIVHRTGDILPGNPIVLTAVCSAHRAAAFDACRFLMEALKSRATFWKKETLSSGDTRWVTKNT